MILADKDKDGIVMMYVQGGIIYPVMLTDEQKAMIEVILPAALNNELHIVRDRPLGKLQWKKAGVRENGQ